MMNGWRIEVDLENSDELHTEGYSDAWRDLKPIKRLSTGHYALRIEFCAKLFLEDRSFWPQQGLTKKIDPVDI